MKRRHVCGVCMLVGWLAVTPVFAGVIKEDYRPATIFGITTTGVYDPSDAYNVAGVPWHVDLDPLRPTAVTLTETSADFILLQNVFPTATTGYQFVVSSATLPDNSLVVHTYDAQYGTVKEQGVIGADFHVEYVPPSGIHTNVHWIQIICDNHNITDNPGHGNLEYIVDSAAASPYYDYDAAADDTNFYDDPRRDDVDRKHWWYAELFLVTGPPAADITPATPAVVTLYNTGIKWGWTNVPEPATIVSLILSAIMLQTRRGRVRAA